LFSQEELIKLSAMLGAKLLLVAAGSGLGQDEINGVILRDLDTEDSLMDRGFAVRHSEGFTFSREARDFKNLSESASILWEGFEPTEEGKHLESKEMLLIGSTGFLAVRKTAEGFAVQTWDPNEAKEFFQAKTGVPKTYAPTEKFAVAVNTESINLIADLLKKGDDAKSQIVQAGLTENLALRLVDLGVRNKAGKLFSQSRNGGKNATEVSFRANGGNYMLVATEGAFLGQKTVFAIDTLQGMLYCLDRLLGDIFSGKASEKT
jgi:hypothetical protein